SCRGCAVAAATHPLTSRDHHYGFARFVAQSGGQGSSQGPHVFAADTTAFGAVRQADSHLALVVAPSGLIDGRAPAEVPSVRRTETAVMVLSVGKGGTTVRRSMCGMKQRSLLGEQAKQHRRGACAGRAFHGWHIRGTLLA